MEALEDKAVRLINEAGLLKHTALSFGKQYKDVGMVSAFRLVDQPGSIGCYVDVTLEAGPGEYKAEQTPDGDYVVNWSVQFALDFHELTEMDEDRLRTLICRRYTEAVESLIGPTEIEEATEPPQLEVDHEQ